MSWLLTQQAFDKFLACLDGDRERAGAKYELVRHKLVKFFEWRGTLHPEEHADQTLNRVSRKIDEGEEIRDIVNYSFGVARLVFLESLNDPESEPGPLDDSLSIQPIPDDYGRKELRLACFGQCMRDLPDEGQELIIQYYQKEKRAKIENRRALAHRLGIPLNALRIRALRIREKLEECVNDCLEKS